VRLAVCPRHRCRRCLPLRREEGRVVKYRLHGRSQAAKAARAPGTRSAPEPADVTWARAELREQLERVWGGEARAAEPREQADTRDRPLPDGRQAARTVTTTGNSIIKGMTPVEEFAEHGESKAGPAGARQARAETADPIAWQA